MYQPKMKAAIGRPSREEHDKNPCIVCPSILGGIFRPAPASSRRPNPAAAAGWRVAGAAPRRAQLRSLPAGVVATESLSCLCILGHRLSHSDSILDSHSVMVTIAPMSEPAGSEAALSERARCCQCDTVDAYESSSRTPQPPVT